MIRQCKSNIHRRKDKKVLHSKVGGGVTTADRFAQIGNELGLVSAGAVSRATCAGPRAPAHRRPLIAFNSLLLPSALLRVDLSRSTQLLIILDHLYTDVSL